MRLLSIAAAILLTVVATSCHSGDGPFGRVCTAELRSTLRISVINSVTGEHEPGATIVVTGLSVYDSVTAPYVDGFGETQTGFPGVDYLAWENRVKGGLYGVSVRKAGFVRQDLTTLVPSDDCHSGPGPQLEVRLKPE